MRTIADFGWRVESFRPLVLRHRDGSIATERAVHAVLSAYGLDLALSPAPAEDLQRNILMLQLDLAKNHLVDLRRSLTALDDYEAWKAGYDLVFSDRGSKYVGTLLAQLGAPLDYYDPDADYKDDVLAYINALEEHVLRLKREQLAPAA